MERLTGRNSDGGAFYKNCFREDTCAGIGCSEKCDHCKHSYNACEKLAVYEDAEEQGLLIRLPCKVGDVVYTNMRASGWYKREKNKPYKANVAFIGINGKDNFMNVVFENDNVLQFLLSDIGKTVFLTREEAEAALERMSEKENENE